MEEMLKKIGLEEDVIKNILKGMKDNKIYTTKEENIEERYSKVKAQKEDLETKLKEANTTLTDLKKNNADNETLQTKVKEYEGKIKTLQAESEAKIKNLTLDNAINNLLTQNKAKHSDLLSSKFDREKLAVNEDGTITGLDEQFKGIKESYKDLFEEKVTGTTPNNTGSSTQQTDAALDAFDKYF